MGRKTGTRISREAHVDRLETGELEAALPYRPGLQPRTMPPPQIAFLRGSGRLDAETFRCFSDVLAKTKFDTSTDTGTFSAADLNIRLGMSYVLNRKPTLTRTSTDGTTSVQKVDPVYFSIAPYLGLDVAVGPPIAPQAAAAATPAPTTVPNDGGGLKLNPNLGLKLRLDF